MRFLIDRCAGRQIADRLRALGHDVIEARSQDPDPGDAALLQTAAAEQRILVTMDKDFGALIFRKGADHAGLIRLPHLPSAPRLALMTRILETVPEAELVRAVVTIKGNRLRISRHGR